LGCWLPRAIDREVGGFHQNFAYDWTKKPDAFRSVVYQSRLTWLAALVGDQATADHGVEFLWRRLWDHNLGGFWWSIGLDGKAFNPEKHSYGNAFAIFALSKAKHRDKAMQVFDWLDRHAFDSQNGGYFDALDNAGNPIMSPGGNLDAIGTPYGIKSMNSHIHLLEAFIELFLLNGDPLVKNRLSEVFDLLLTKYVREDGALLFEMTPDWRSNSDVDSYGHGLETAFLLIEAAEVLGTQEDEMWELAQTMADYYLKVAWDNKNGGFFYEGHFGRGPSDRKKDWWTHAEAFNILRMLGAKFGGRYQTYADQTWNFIETYVLDDEHGGWRSKVHEDGTPYSMLDKSNAWTEAYHQARAVYLASK
jgi:cellobiose epimerase